MLFSRAVVPYLLFFFAPLVLVVVVVVAEFDATGVSCPLSPRPPIFLRSFFPLSSAICFYLFFIVSWHFAFFVPFVKLIRRVTSFLFLFCFKGVVSPPHCIKDERDRFTIVLQLAVLP